MADEDVPAEEYPAEIEEYLTEFDSSVDSLHNMVKTMVSVSKNELVQKLDPLEQAKLDLMSAYALNSLYWIHIFALYRELGGSKNVDPVLVGNPVLVCTIALPAIFPTAAYLVTQGVNPKEHGVKQELERIRTYMNKVREIADRKTAARLDKAAASRFMRSALWEPGQEKANATPGGSQAKERKEPSRK